MNAELIFVAFLDCQKTDDIDFKDELRSLERSLNVDGDLQTDSHGDVSFRLQTDGGPQAEDNNALCKRIGAQLAQMGDDFRLEGKIKQEVVESLVHDLLTESLTETRFEDAVKSLLDNLPPGLDEEKATLLVAMSLTCKISHSVPGRLQTCFTTAMSVIRRNCGHCLEHLINQG